MSFRCSWGPIGYPQWYKSHFDGLYTARGDLKNNRPLGIPRAKLHDEHFIQGYNEAAGTHFRPGDVSASIQVQRQAHADAKAARARLAKAKPLNTNGWSDGFYVGEGLRCKCGRIVQRLYDGGVGHCCRLSGVKSSR